MSGMRLGEVTGIPGSLFFLRERRHWRVVDGYSLVVWCLLASMRQLGIRLGRLHHIQTHTLQALRTELQRLGSAIRQIDDPAWDDRSPVVDPHDYGPPIAQVRDPD